MGTITDEPERDTVLVLDEGELLTIEACGAVEKGELEIVASGCEYRADVEGGRVFILPSRIDALRKGKAVNLNLIGDVDEPSLIHADRAGTPKADRFVAERMFERFKDCEGEARQVAQEALHLLGYEVEKNVEYELVDKQEDEETSIADLFGEQ